MLESLTVELQVYIFGMILGISVPLLLFWLLHRPLREFLREIFHNSAIEQFWLRVVLIGFVASTLSVAIAFRADAAALADDVALFFNVADKCKQMFDSLIVAMLTIFLPLLAAYTILHLPGRETSAAAAPKDQP